MVEALRPPIVVKTETLPAEIERKHEPFLTWDVLQEARLPQLWDIPAEDIEVVKTAIILDSFSGLSLHEKRRVLAFRLWSLDGKFARIKKYIGENKGPSLDALVHSVWDAPGLEHRYEEVDEIMETMEQVIPNGDDLPRFMVVFDNFLDMERKGLDFEDIVNSKDKINGYGNNLAERRSIGFLRHKKLGRTDEDIIQALRLKKGQLEQMEKRYLEKGYIAPDNVLELNPLQAKVAYLRAMGLSKNQIIHETGEKPGTIDLAISVLIFMNVVRAKPNKVDQSEEFKRMCLRVEKVYLDNPGWDYNQVSVELGISKPEVKMARMVLMDAGRLRPIEDAKERHRKPHHLQNEQNVYALRLGNPSLTHSQIAQKLGIPMFTVGLYVSRGIKKGVISRKRSLPSARK